MKPLQDYFLEKYKYPAYVKTTDLLTKMRVHSDGIFPETLIGVRRPSETQEVFDYRKSIWEPITKNEFGKIITCLNKIRKSPDWSIKFDPAKVNAKIRDGETLADYLDSNFPYFTSITNWAFDVLLRATAVDANAVICTLPISTNVAANDYLRPFPHLFYSDQIYDYVEGEYIVARFSDKIIYEDNGQKEGNKFLVFTKTSYSEYSQTSDAGEYNRTLFYEHTLPRLTVTKLRGFFIELIGGVMVFDSKVSGIVPRFNEAVREYSDLQAEIVQNIFSERWEISDDDCSVCKGTTLQPGTTDLPCTTCGGTGAKPRGPYSRLVLKQPMQGDAALPTPPVGFVEKMIDIAKLQDERIDGHIYKGFSSINMEFVANVPLNQSGIAKTVDRDEFNSFVNSFAETLVGTMDSVVYDCALWRYMAQLNSEKDIKELLPVIAVPERYDFLTAALLQDELSTAKTGGVNPVILKAIEADYIGRRFNSDPATRQRLLLIITLDPMAGVSEQDKMVRLSNGGVTKKDYIISCNIEAFVDKAIAENPDFVKMTETEQLLVIGAYGDQQILDKKVAIYEPPAPQPLA
jgi:hypothetical protein